MGCCRSDDDFSPSRTSALTAQLAVLGSSIALSLIFLLVAGIKFGSWLPMINLMYIVLTPIAVILSEAMGGNILSFDSFNETKQAFANFGSCFFGLILSSIIGLPLVLLHNGKVSKEAFGLWMASTVVTLLASLYYWIARARSRSADY